MDSIQQLMNKYLTVHCWTAAKDILTQAVCTDLRVMPWKLTQEEEDGGGYDGVDTDEEVDAHIDDESHLCILEDAWQEIHPGEGSKPEELTMKEYLFTHNIE